jgi:hypothetical protein
LLLRQAAEIYSRKHVNRISRIPDHILAARGVVSIRGLSHNFGFGIRQFERRFLKEVGITPKLFAEVQKAARSGRFVAAMSAFLAGMAGPVRAASAASLRAWRRFGRRATVERFMRAFLVRPQSYKLVSSCSWNSLRKLERSEKASGKN